MPLTVTVFLDPQTTLEAGVNLDLLSGGALAGTATSAADGTVTFNVDPASLTAAALRFSSNQPPPA